MRQSAFFIVLGYLSGSVLFANVFAALMKKDGIIEKSKDGNPGTANAFQYGGFLCGICTLLGDLVKGFFPVYLYTHYAKAYSATGIAFALVIAAPVIGHDFPLFYKFQGGKGIATTFGCMLGLLPLWQPLGMLVVFFILFSVVLRISPHFYRTVAAYVCTLACMIYSCRRSVWIGFLIITSVVFYRLHTSRETRERIRINLLWMH